MFCNTDTPIHACMHTHTLNARVPLNFLTVVNQWKGLEIGT